MSSSYLYRLSNPLGEYVLNHALSAATPEATIRFNITQHPTRIAMVEALK